MSYNHLQQIKSSCGIVTVSVCTTRPPELTPSCIIFNGPYHGLNTIPGLKIQMTLITWRSHIMLHQCYMVTGGTRTSSKDGWIASGPGLKPGPLSSGVQE